MRRALTLTLALGMLLALAACSSASASVKLFQSPSKNIGCVIGPSIGARCDIRVRSWHAPPKPKSCPLDFGNGLTVGKHGRGRFTCAGDTVLGQGHVLPYGQAIRRGHYRCVSLTIGMRCVNQLTQHGFKISRQHARRF